MIEEIGRTVEIVGARRYHQQQRQHLKIPVGVNITEKIPTALGIWRRST
jgi:hypothetical protein